MSSTAERSARDSDALSPDALWISGEVFAHHPRVRRAHIAGRAITIHRFRQVAPGGITCLAADPARSELAGLRLLADGYYVLDFIEGDLLDAIEPGRALVDPLAEALGRVWASPTEGVLPAAREQPVLGPATRRQYVEMPDAVLASAHDYGAVAVELCALLDARGPGDTFIHGDLKADNAVRTPAGDARFIDWECCGLGHAEDDLASLLASLCVYALGRAVRRSAEGAALGHNVGRELAAVQEFSSALLYRAARSRPQVTTNRLGEAFLLSCLCRLQGLLFVPTSEAVRLAVDEFVRRSFQEGPDAVSTWLRGAADARPEVAPC